MSIAQRRFYCDHEHFIKLPKGFLDFAEENLSVGVGLYMINNITDKSFREQLVEVADWIKENQTSITITG